MSYEWSIEDDSQALIVTPGDKNIDKEFLHEADSVTEYSIGVWVRWLTDIPDKL